MNLATWIDRNGRHAAGRPAISVGGRPVLTYGDWARRSAVMAAHLQEHCRPGDRVAIAMTNRPDFLVSLFAIWHAGLAAVPMNAKLHANEFRYIIEDAGASLVLASPDLAESVSQTRMIVTESADWQRLGSGDGIAVVPRAPDDLAWLFYTSGTTGRPKGAMLTHRNLLMASLSYYADLDHVETRDAILHAAPLSHGSGIYALPFIAQAANNILPESHSFDPAEVTALLAQHERVSFFAAPTMVMRLVNDPVFAASDNRGLDTIVYGGGPMHVPDLLRALDVIGPRLSQIYGQGEAPMTITALRKSWHADRSRPRWLDIMGSVGLARSDVEVRVLDADDRDMPAGEIGEIVCRGDVVMAGYWRNPDATAETLRGGWLRTGDLGSLDEEGFLTLKDRSKDVIISGGSNVYPREVEDVLLRHPAVLEASVIGRAHADWGEQIVACIVPRPGATVSSQELDALCLSEVARFKRPRAYVFLDALPKNNYGKVLKTELRRHLGDDVNAITGEGRM
jgi:acyl-CoA synthetase (AMP-forming)/AMP-acid ligase II